MPLPRFAKLPAEKQAVILDAARNEIVDRGFADASMNRIIAAAGISKGAMYYYFADRDDLMAAVVHDVGDRFEAEVIAAVGGPEACEDFWPCIERGLIVAAQHLGADPQALALGNAFHSGASLATIQELHTRVAGWIEKLVVLGQTLGAVRTDVPTSTLVAATTGLVTAVDRHFFMEGAEITKDSRTARLLSRLTQDLLAPRP